MKQEKEIESEKVIWFRSICIENGLSPSIEQLKKLKHFVEMLLEWNKKINLISRRDEQNVWDYHLLHCVAPLFHIKIPPNSKIVDIGTGGGLPSIPLKIILPEISLLCIDSVGKKAKAVSQMARELGLENVEIAWGRAEDIAKRPEHNKKYNFVIARSVARLVDLINWSQQFYCNEVLNYDRDFLQPPALLTYKGGNLSGEILEAKKRFKSISVEEIILKLKETDIFEKAEKKILIVRNL